MQFFSMILKSISQTIHDIIIGKRHILPLHYTKDTVPLKNIVIHV